jgi:hypothetical protein
VSHGDVEFDFLLAPGADPSRIRMRVPADVGLDPSGALTVDGVRLRAPAAWQDIRDKRAIVPVRFALNRRRISFHLGKYDPSAPLTIDPVVQFATYLGGSGNDIGMRVISGSDGAIYTAGNTMSADFPASLPPGDLLNRPENLLQQTAYIARMKPDGSALDWSLFIGGSARQSVFALKQDVFGNLYLVVGTTSPNFPVTAGAWHATIDPSMTDLFLVKLDAQTGHIQISTFLGIALYDNNLDAGAMLATDAAGGVYIGGYRLYGGNFTPTSGAFDTSAPSSAFVLRLNSAITAAVYESYWPLGSVAAMDVDGAGNLVLGGVAFGGAQSGTPPFPAVNPLPGVDQSPVFPAQAYLARLNATGTAVDFATLLHGDGRDSGIGDLKIASDGTIYALGWTSGTSYPQVNPLILDLYPSSGQNPLGDLADVPFLARLAADGKSLVQSTLFSGSPYTDQENLDTNLRLALQPNGYPCLAGLNMPIAFQTPGGIVGTPDNGTSQNPGGWSLSCEDSAGLGIHLSTSLPQTGGSGYTDIATTASGSLLFTGSAMNTFAATRGVFQPKFGGYGPYNYDYPSLDRVSPGDAFLMSVAMNNPAPNIQLLTPDFVLLDNSASGAGAAILSGSGFGYGATTTLNGQPVTETFIDSGHATISFSSSALQPGDNHIVMTLPPPGGGSSDRILTGINAPPSSISVSPSSVTQGAAETKLVIRATNLSPASTLDWNGSPRAASFVLDSSSSTSGHFELLLEPADLAQASSALITVSNPGPGGGVSPPVQFIVQPVSGVGPPVLGTLDPLIYGGTPALGPQVSFGGSGFTAGTIAFWDGAQVPVSSFTATSIAIQPPSGDLTQLGEHSVYVANGTFQSLPVPVLIGRSVTPISSAYDPKQNRVYILNRTTYNTNGSADLQVFDDATGNLLNSVAGIVSGAQVSALSADGHYLFIAASSATASSSAQILRYNTLTKAVDLQWQVPFPNQPISGNPVSGIGSMVTPPNAPETLIVCTAMGQVLIFDGDYQRPNDSFSAGFPTSGEGPIFFASATRIYGGPGDPTAGHTEACWIWMDYDAYGISGGQPSCSGEPPETQHDSGVTYLTDGTRTYIVSLPAVGYAPLYVVAPAPSLALDLTHRQAWEFGASDSGAYQLLQYGMDTRQFQLEAQINSPEGTGTLYPTGSGPLLVLPYYMLRVNTSTAQPMSRRVGWHFPPPPREAAPSH